jgi:uncharacterized membrane protein YozB (DUF420 family)
LIPIPLSALPAVNATLNATSAVLLAAGYFFIRRRRIAAHRACMLAAVGVSSLFLISYIIYHLQVGATRFPGSGGVRVLYLVILATHTVLAVTIVPLVAVTLIRALRGRFERHRRIARWTLPAWLYVSVTGVVIYFMLYHMYPSAEESDQGLARGPVGPGRFEPRREYSSGREWVSIEGTADLRVEEEP